MPRALDRAGSGTGDLDCRAPAILRASRRDPLSHLVLYVHVMGIYFTAVHVHQVPVPRCFGRGGAHLGGYPPPKLVRLRRPFHHYSTDSPIQLRASEHNMREYVDSGRPKSFNKA